MALTQHALQDPSLDGVAQRQYAAYHATARATLQRIATGFGVTWAMPVEDVARMLVVVTDGVTLAWLVDRDSPRPSPRSTRSPSNSPPWPADPPDGESSLLEHGESSIPTRRVVIPARRVVDFHTASRRSPRAVGFGG